MPDTPPVEKKDYLCVEFPAGGVVQLMGTKPATMEYVAFSKDARTWEKHTSATDTSTMQVSAGRKIYIKGKGGDNGSAMGVANGNKGWYLSIRVNNTFPPRVENYAILSGNIMSLLYDDDFEDKLTVDANAFVGIFNYNCAIKDISELKLPATTVGDWGYSKMFYNSLTYNILLSFTKPPKLPATTVGAYSYQSMFQGVGTLEEMPDLPATTLGEHCYEQMFQDCSIKEAKVLPATTLTQSCYNAMFASQQSNIHIPHNMLPATMLTANCYLGMFAECDKLEYIPSDLLPAATHIDETSGNEVTSLASSCYRNMFLNCTALTYVPDRLLPATILASSCYNGMFKSCKALTRVPRNLLPATTLADECYQSMFEGCTSIVRLPYGLLPAMTMVTYAYKTMFKGCTSLRSIPDNLLPATTLAPNCYESMFSGTQQSSSGTFINGPAITSIPQGLLRATALAPYCYTNMFAGCGSLTDIGSPIIHENMSLANYCFEGMFRDCTALVSTDKHLIPTSTLASGCCSKMFMGCTHLTNTIEFVNVVTANCYGQMYEGCTALTDFENLPATTLVASCYLAMFRGCGFTTLEGKSLTSGDVASSSYQSMFENCVELETVPANFIQAASFRGSDCCAAMFKGCKKLSVAPYVKPIDTTDPNTLIAGARAFKEMFANCYDSKTVEGETVYTGLTHMASIVDGEPARIPFTQSNMESFMWMFSGCKAMTEIPFIDVEYLEGTGAFEEMYNECYSLEVIPNGMFTKILKRAVSTTDCGSFALGMFQYCKKLKTVPTNLISGQTITDGGYSAMFKGCESLETPIALPSVSNSYNYMYQGCISLTSIATMDANLAGYYRYMYQGCTSLTTVNNLPNLTSTGTKIKDYTGFFKDCTSLASVSTVQGTDVLCSEMFSGCTALTSVALNLTFSESNAVVAGSCYQMFYDAHTGGAIHSNLTRVTGSIKINSIVGAIANKGQFESMFQNCITLTALPTFTVNTTTAGTNCYRGMFAGCKVLPTVQKALTSGITTLAPYCYQSMYIGCSAITAIPDGTLPATTAASSCYAYMFNGSSIAEVKDGAIALTTLAANCCQQMFCNCKSLTKAYTPTVVEPVSNCYAEMFYGCTNLAEVHCMLNIQNKQITYTGSWLNFVAQTGKFYARSGSDWERSGDGIPNDWTVEYVNA